MAMTVSGSLASLCDERSEEETAKAKCRKPSSSDAHDCRSQCVPILLLDGFDWRPPWVLMRSPCAPGGVETLDVVGPTVHYLYILSGYHLRGVANLKTNMPRVSIVFHNSKMGCPIFMSF